MTRPRTAIADVAELHHGHIASRHLVELEISEGQRDWLVACEFLVRARYGAYRVAGVPSSWRGDLLAAVWAGGDRAVSSHRSATALRDLTGGDQTIQEVQYPAPRRGRHAFIAHETSELPDEDITIVDAIPTTSVERTLLDLGAVRSRPVVERAVEAALRRELTTEQQLQAVLARVGRRGRNGTAALRAVLDARDPTRALTESDPEMLLLQVLRDRGLPEPRTQYVVRHRGRFIARVDAAYPEWSIALEYESFAFHTGKEALIRDSRRRNDLVAVDWLPISVTKPDLTTGGHRLCAQICDVIDLRRVS
jgi:hypothetical protein